VRPRGASLHPEGARRDHPLSQKTHENVRTTDSLAVAHQQIFQNVVRRPHLQDPDPAGLPLPALPLRRGPRSRDVEP
jgi:hypothetical protein